MVAPFRLSLLGLCRSILTVRLKIDQLLEVISKEIGVEEVLSLPNKPSLKRLLQIWLPISRFCPWNVFVGHGSRDSSPSVQNDSITVSFVSLSADIILHGQNHFSGSQGDIV